jgi:hypothetical protein
MQTALAGVSSELVLQIAEAAAVVASAIAGMIIASNKRGWISSARSPLHVSTRSAAARCGTCCSTTDPSTGWRTGGSSSRSRRVEKSEDRDYPPS